MHSATVPLYIEQDRPFIDLALTGPYGETRTIRCWLDSGGGVLYITEAVARELGLRWTPPPDGSKLAPVTIPRASIGGFDLDLTGARVCVELGTPHDPGVKADGFMGGHILARYHVIFDYPAQTFTIAKPGVMTPRGIPVPSPHRPPMCFPRLAVEIDGEPYGMLLDTGATCTMISTELIQKLSEKHPDWPHTVGPAGVANMVGGPWEVDLPLMRFPSVRCSGVTFADVLVVGRSPGRFEQYMSSMMSGPVIGAVAGNLLKQYRVEIDYANQLTYFERGTGSHLADMDLVGLIVQAHPDGTYTVSGTSAACGYPDGAVQQGDKLLAVDDRPVAGLSRPDVIGLLMGRPGQGRRLEIERAGNRLEVTLPVVRLI